MYVRISGFFYVVSAAAAKVRAWIFLNTFFFLNKQTVWDGSDLGCYIC